MLIEIGHVEAMFRYPVKSMAGKQLEVAELAIARLRQVLGEFSPLLHAPCYAIVSHCDADHICD